MKTCPTCQGSFPNNYAICPQDGTALEEIGGWAEGSVIRGKYRLLAKVGQGGMGSVWKATHLAFEEVRALKVISPELLTDELFVKRFKHEAVITFKLKHPNAVRVDDIDESEDGRPFIVMEFIEGKSLKNIIRNEGPLPAGRTCTIIKQAAAALEAAHKIGMVHRDIKPDNIAVIETLEGERVKVLDFGIAKVKEARLGDAAGMTLTGTGVVIGTPQYMSPEQAMGKRGDELDGRADLYSLGIVMYEMLTADLPFKADTTMEMLLAHMQKAPAPIRTLHPELNVPDCVAALTMRLLEKDRDQRPASARALIQEIEKAEAEMSHEVGATRVVSPLEVPFGGTIPPRRQPAVAPPPPPQIPDSKPQAPAEPRAPERAPVAKPESPRPQPKPESRWGLWVALIILVVGLGGGGLYIFRRPSTPASQEQRLPPQEGTGQPGSSTPAQQPRGLQSDTTTPAAENPQPSVFRTRENTRATQHTQKPGAQTTTETVRDMPPARPSQSPVDPKKIKAAITEGDIFRKHSDYDAALSAYQQGLKLDPSNADLKDKFQSAQKACLSEKRLGTITAKCEPQ